MKNKKSLLIIIGIIVLLALIIFFAKNNYKKTNIGNNISNKNLDEYEKYILNIKSYEATSEVTINSNKNTNKYLMKQSNNRRI